MESNNRLTGRSLLTLSDFSPIDIRLIIDLAHQAKADRRAGRTHQRFRGLSLAMLYEKPSTRTRCAFDTAFGEEGGHSVFLGAGETHLDEKESIIDTARVLGRMFDAIQFRGYMQTTANDLATYSGIPVYNGLTNSRHPTQVLADLLTLEEHFGKLSGLKVVYVGDCRNNIASSLMIGCSLMGVNFVSVGPRERLPSSKLLETCKQRAKANNCNIDVGTDLELVSGADALYTDVWVSMGEEAHADDLVKQLAPYQVDSALLTKTGNKTCIFMHDLPAVKGNEVTAEIFESKASVVWDQVENRKHTAKALMLSTLLGRHG